jgi:hypothetical protein
VESVAPPAGRPSRPEGSPASEQHGRRIAALDLWGPPLADSTWQEAGAPQQQATTCRRPLIEHSKTAGSSAIVAAAMAKAWTSAASLFKIITAILPPPMVAVKQCNLASRFRIMNLIFPSR